ncbi:MAG: hypothetical protein Fur0019_10350 [Tibeticola sp.]
MAINSSLRRACALFLGLSTAAGLALAAAPAAPTETLPSGVKIVHNKVGDGASPKATDVVRVNYRGTLTDGKEFDSSYSRGTPASFPLNRVIPCWTQALQAMKVGGQASLTCPSETAYGARGVGGVIPPNATLNFEVELLGIDK